MPIFDYQCTSCSHQFSELRKISEKDNKINCPECSSENTKRTITCCSLNTGSSSSAPAMPSCGGNCGCGC